jgi:hypothetical protein
MKPIVKENIFIVIIILLIMLLYFLFPEPMKAETNIAPTSCFNKYNKNQIAKQKIFLTAFISYSDFYKFYQKNLFTFFIRDWEYLKDRLLYDNYPYEYFTEKLLKEGTTTNTLEHTFQTVKNVDALENATKEEKQDLRLIMFMHDFGKWVSRQGHEKNSAIIARNILENLNFDKTKINLYCKIIEMHGDLGIYPKTKAKLELLTKKELRLLYFTTLCDIGNRYPFDTKGNRYKLDMVYRHLLNEKIEPENIEIKLNLIDKTAHILDFLYDEHVYLCYYFKNFLIEYNLKSIRKIAYAA